MTAAAARQRRRRERQREGLCCLRIEVEEAALEDALRAAGFLAETADSRAELAAALEHVVRLWAASVTRDDVPRDGVL